AGVTGTNAPAGLQAAKDAVIAGTTTVVGIQDKVDATMIIAALEKRFTMLHDDAVYVTTNHKAQAKYVAELPESELIFTGMSFKYTDNKPIPPGWGTFLLGPLAWTPEAKNNVKRMIGQIGFVINTEEFKDRFNTAGTDKFNPAAFAGGSPGFGAKIPPKNYSIFRATVQKQMKDWKTNPHNHFDSYDLSVYQTTVGGNAYGLQKIPSVFLKRSDMEDTKTLHHNASLLLHEFTHTFGYSHTNFSNLTPNNVPYYVQAITWDNGMKIDEGCKIFMSAGNWSRGAWLPKRECSYLGKDQDPTTHPTMTPQEVSRVNLFARFFGNSDVTKRKGGVSWKP
ncbi:hypothetical protein, partial [Vibrio mediterranei]|uniref:hypothetical protein n=1 Tax=Vibrio mediterranei TaxID=689 RepID=UPI00148CBEEB